MCSSTNNADTGFEGAVELCVGLTPLHLDQAVAQLYRYQIVQLLVGVHRHLHISLGSSIYVCICTHAQGCLRTYMPISIDIYRCCSIGAWGLSADMQDIIDDGRFAVTTRKTRRSGRTAEVVKPGTLHFVFQLRALHHL